MREEWNNEGQDSEIPIIYSQGDAVRRNKKGAEERRVRIRKCCVLLGWSVPWRRPDLSPHSANTKVRKLLQQSRAAAGT